MFETIELDQEKNTRAKIKVVGVGGAGGNAVNRMVNSGFTGVDFISVNTDALALENSKANLKIALGTTLTKGLGAGAKPEVGHDAILESRDEVVGALEGADMVFITAGMGGGTGTGAAPIIAEICKELGILSVAVVTRPFLFEGPVRTKNSLRGLDALTSNVDTIITIHNQKILAIADSNMTMKDAFASADNVLIGAVRGISEIILKHGEIQVDFADVKTIMTSGGDALMGTGTAEGENRAVAAAQKAIHSPLLDDIQIQGASGILVNITGGEDMGILEINEAMTYVYNEVGEDNVPNIIFGTVINPELHDEIQVTVIATGFRKNEQNKFVPKAGITGDDYNSYVSPEREAPQAAPVTPVSQPSYNQPASNHNVAPTYQDMAPQAPQQSHQQPTQASSYQQPSSSPMIGQMVAQMAQAEVIEEIEEIDMTQASLTEKSELEMENQIASVSYTQEETIVEDMFRGQEVVEEPVAIQSQVAPMLQTNYESTHVEDVRSHNSEETVWNPEMDQVTHPSPESMPAYLREENRTVQPSVQPTAQPSVQPTIQPVAQEPISQESTPSSMNSNSDIDDDYETPAFLRSQDF